MVQHARRIVSVLRVGYKRSADSRHIVELLEPVTLGTQYLAKRDREDEDPLAIVGSLREAHDDSDCCRAFSFEPPGSMLW